MGPVEPALNQGIESDLPASPNTGPGPLSFTPDQEIALFGGPAEPGQEYTVTVRAGEPGPDGALSFEVVADAPAGAPGAENPMEGHEPESPAADIAEDSEDVTKALGYDRNALQRDRSKRGIPKLSAKDLEED